MERYICIHGHFYQPPRENPWLEEVELQDSALPYHDWNERITAECYAPNSSSRILDAQGRIVDIINNYSRMSFNVGPTLLSWMERHRPEVYASIVEADKLSRERFSGHGSAVAQVYNHMIMPLANRRDKETQVIWGIKDFERHFGRFPEGMWLSETAADTETLEVLAELNIKYTILAPRQAKRVKQMAKGARWHDVSDGRVDPKQAYLCQLPSGKSINLFFYDGPVSQDIAFGGLLNDGVAYANRLLEAFDDKQDGPQLVHIATDGESYGHHHRHGDMALSYCLHHVEKVTEATLTNYGEFLEKFPPTALAEIHDNSSWSCVHGVERWKENCGCNSGRQGWTQAWRKPLREALDGLRDRLIPLYEREASALLKNPWEVRNDYYEVVVDRSPKHVDEFLTWRSTRELSHEEKSKALRLLEMQRNCMLMYTSCGWFFDDISGIETTQVLQYASIVIQLAESLFGEPFESGFLERLAQAPSNVLENGAQVYEQSARPARLDMLRVGAHYGIASLFFEDPDKTGLYCYSSSNEDYVKREGGKFRLAIGKTDISSTLTWEHQAITFAVLHFGDHNISGGVRAFIGDVEFARMRKEILNAFDTGDMTVVVKLIGEHFGSNNYSLWHLFKDEQRRVLLEILEETLLDAESSFQQVYQSSFPIMTFLHLLRNPIPSPLLMASEYVVNASLKRLFMNDQVDLRKLEALIQQVQKWSFTLDSEMIRFVAGEWVIRAMERFRHGERDVPLLLHLNGVLSQINALPLELDLWKAQNIYFAVSRKNLTEIRMEAESGDKTSNEWVKGFRALGDHLKVKIA